ncbi:exonuclease 1 isoform X1 [Salvia hispanica]|uniref:exonuclease 1 isoform X1 n=1 Tax=Salvia hispanica TaxID=49212 RepID=UPI0020093CE1|nr:exonuclease 1 isoform X1 [Salvia hispanica]
MGINNLLKFMKPYVESVHIKKYAGKRVGIDAYSWLHKGAYSCSMEVCLDMEGDKKNRFLQYFMHRISMLRHYKITPVVVFDGGSTPCKAATEDGRHRKRKANRDLAMEKLKEGDTDAASELFQKAVSITPQMAHQLIQILRSENVEFVVAPYEADAQLAYLASLETEKGGIVAIISEDSDLLAYNCPAVVFKMDRYGKGEEIILKNALNVAGRKPSFMNFDRELFTGMCILAGCDFLPSVPGIGIVKAYNLVAKYRNLDRVLSVLKLEKGKVVPEDYPTAFRQALAVFQHARVYDAASKKLKPLNPLTPELLQGENGDLDFLGPDLSPSIAVAIAEGNLDPCTMEAFNHFPQSGYKHSLSFTDSASQLSTQEEATGSMQEGCFTVVSCHKTVKKRIRGDMPLDGMKSSSEGKQMTVISEEVLNESETSALKKLGFPSRNEAFAQKEPAPLRSTLNIPSNNPFKKQKRDDEVQLNEAMSTVEQASEVTEVEKPEIFSATQKSEESIDSKLIKPKAKRIAEKLSKQSNPKHVISSKVGVCSILNFFSRV